MPETKVRTVRVADPLWTGAQAVAASQGEDVSAFIRRALAAYEVDPNATDAALAQIRGRGAR